MIRKWLAAVLTAVMVLNSSAVAEENAAASVSADGWTATETEGGIIVEDIHGTVIAQLPHEMEEGVGAVLMTDDYNFDGRADLAALTSMGTANAYYTIWLWEAGGGFTLNEALGIICAPRADALKEEIVSFERLSAAEYLETWYGWQEGMLVMLRQRKTEYLDEAGERVHILETAPGEEKDVILKDIEMSSEEWDEALGLMVNAEMMAEALYTAGKYQVDYEGIDKVDSDRYHMYSVIQDGAAAGRLYYKVKNPQIVLLDDSMDGDNYPQWLVSEDGSKRARIP